MKKRFAERILEGLADAVAYAKGDKTRGTATRFRMPEVDVKSVRQKIGLSQEEFGDVFAISARTVQEWEQYRKSPSGPSRVLLAVIEANPASVKKVLHNLGRGQLPSKKKKVTRHDAQVGKAKKTDAPKKPYSRSKKFV
jgi:putative transcriptional regulator